MSSFLFRGFLGCLGSVTPASSGFFGDLDLLRFSGDLDLFRFSGDLDRDLRRSGDFSAFTTGGFFELLLSGDFERDLRDFFRSSSLDDELLELEELLERVLPSPILDKDIQELLF